MGSCLSSDRNSVNRLTAKVISIKGNLLEYSVLVTVSQVLLEMEEEETSSSSCFLCNSDQLYYDDYIQALDSDAELQVGQIYFLLPTNRLQYRLTASDMAALAVKASSALVKKKKKNSTSTSTSGQGGRRKIQISPISEVKSSLRNKRFDNEKPIIIANGDVVVGKGITSNSRRSSSSGEASKKKFQRSASKRAMIAYRSFRVKLSTIYEGSVLT